MEMKKAWTRPLTTVQQFDANEAISACGDSGTNYYFECNAGESNKQYDVFQTGVSGQTFGGTNLTPDDHFLFFLRRAIIIPVLKHMRQTA